MKQPFPYIFLLMLVCILALVHISGVYFYLYWQVSWYDHVVNLLGGLFVSTLITSFVLSKIGAIKQGYVFIICVLSALIASALWEFFEIKSGINVLSTPGYFSNTVGDLISNVIGGCLAYLYILKRPSLKNETV